MPQMQVPQHILDQMPPIPAPGQALDLDNNNPLMAFFMSMLPWMQVQQGQQADAGPGNQQGGQGPPGNNQDNQPNDPPQPPAPDQ